MVMNEVTVNYAVANQDMGERQRQRTVATRRDWDRLVDVAARPARRYANHAGRRALAARNKSAHGLPEMTRGRSVPMASTKRVRCRAYARQP